MRNSVLSTTSEQQAVYLASKSTQFRKNREEEVVVLVFKKLKLERILNAPIPQEGRKVGNIGPSHQLLPKQVPPATTQSSFSGTLLCWSPHFSLISSHLTAFPISKCTLNKIIFNPSSPHISLLPPLNSPSSSSIFSCSLFLLSPFSYYPLLPLPTPLGSLKCL